MQTDRPTDALVRLSLLAAVLGLAAGGAAYVLVHLIGLLTKIISDLTYVLVDPRIDFEGREGR